MTTDPSRLSDDDLAGESAEAEGTYPPDQTSSSSS
jgi:hypothetical protein